MSISISIVESKLPITVAIICTEIDKTGTKIWSKAGRFASSNGFKKSLLGIAGVAHQTTVSHRLVVNQA
jgi:hypothetical protein